MNDTTVAQRVDRKGVFGWMLFDWATQPFHTLIITFVFGPYFASAVAPSDVDGQTLWAVTLAIAGIAVAVLAPVLGAIADSTGPRKPWILGFSIPAIIGSWILWYSVPGDTNIPFVLTGVVLAFIGFEFAAVFNNSMMPTLVPRSHLGRLSGSAWALGYVGGIVSLVFVLGFMASNPETGRTLIGLEPILGLDTETRAGDRASGPLTALWYVVFVLPMFLYTPDVERNRSTAGAVRKGLQELHQTLRNLPSQKSYFSYLIAAMFYRDGLNALYAFGGIYAGGVLGWSIIQIGIFGVLAALAGVFGASIGGQVDDRLGPKTVVTSGIVILIFSCLLVISLSKTQVFFLPVGSVEQPSGLPTILFYVAGCMIGAAGGAMQAASRTLLVDQVTPDKVTEAFGLYALSGKATSYIGPMLIALATYLTGSQRLGVAPILILFMIGLLLLPRVTSAHREAVPA